MDLTKNISINTHSSIRIAGRKVLYFDPYGIDEERHDADIIFVTHDHYDHFDPESIEKVAKSSTLFIAPAGSIDQVSDKVPIKREQCFYMGVGSGWDMHDLRLKAIPAYNIGKPFHAKEKGYLGYLVTMDGIKYYIAGDTDATEEAENVKCDVALIPVGGTYTMDVKEAAALVVKICPKIAIPTHYGSIVGTKEAGREFLNAIKEASPDIEVKLLL